MEYYSEPLWVIFKIIKFLLEYLEWYRSIFDGYNHSSVVQIQDVVFLFKHLHKHLELTLHLLPFWCLVTKRFYTCRHVLPQSEVMYMSSLYSTSLEPRFPTTKHSNKVITVITGLKSSYDAPLPQKTRREKDCQVEECSTLGAGP